MAATGPEPRSVPLIPALKAWRRAHRLARVVWKAGKGLAHRHHPILVHLINMRRCNLACAYCNEYDDSSRPVPLPLMLARIDKLAELGTSMITISGGEPLMHPELDRMVLHMRRRGIVASVITNGYYLSREWIARFNRAGLDYLQISIDNVEPDERSMKSLRLLEPKLRWLAEHAHFGVNINSVVGSGIPEPEDALRVARRARELGFTSSIGIIHDGRGQLRPLGPREMAVYEELKKLGSRGDTRVNRLFQDNLARGRPNDWSCRAGARYLYVDEDGIVSYCSQWRGVPGRPLAAYAREDLVREYGTRKPCAPYCTINCVQRVGIFDNWRSPQAGRAAIPGPESLAPDPPGAAEASGA
jgi:MoaA/NifB/PqqE/SkfB family radical SAM enzyme